MLSGLGVGDDLVVVGAVNDSGGVLDIGGVGCVCGVSLLVLA